MNNNIFQLQLEKCEICQKPAMCGMIDSNNKIRYSCFHHVIDLWRKLKDEE
jgi:hypothetical protein